ncbi:Protein of unknown function DUF1682 [Trinorchestia longiramus]|nr:Protein of unknown function DUF1682 [Trinorchestia longiramus]
MKVLYLLLLSSIILVSFTGHVTAQPQYYEDDDFEDFDNEADAIESMKSSDIRQQFEDDEEDAVVDDENVEEDPGLEDLVEEEDEEDAVVRGEEVDEFSHLADDEEFIGYNSESSSSSSGGQKQHQRREPIKEPKITVADVPLHLRSNWDSFYLELMLLLGLVIYFANFSIGRNKNAKLAMAWFEANRTLLTQQFALVGDDGKPPSESSSSNGASSAPVKRGGGGSAGLQKESENIYSLYCSGRVCVHSMMVEIRLLKRQDLVSVVMQMFRPATDEVVVKIRLDDMESFVMCLATKKMASKYVKDMTDITTFCTGDRKGSLPTKQYASCAGYSKLLLLSEIAEASNAILTDQRTVAVLGKHLARINYLHISDQYSGPQQPDADQQQTLTTASKMPPVQRVAILSFQLLPPVNRSKSSAAKPDRLTSDDMEQLRSLLMLVLYLADKLSRFKLSKESKSKAEKNRSRVEEAFLKATHAVRAERAQEKREEKKRTEREKMMEIDDPEKQRKWEERENRRLAKKKGPKMKQIKVA